MVKEYTVLVLKLSAFIGIAINLAHPKQSKIMRLALGIVLISAIMLPLIDIITVNNSNVIIFPTPDEVDVEMNDEMIEIAFEEGIGKYISSKYFLSEDEVKVNADGFDFSVMKATRIYVTLCGKGVCIDYRKLEDEIAKEFTRGGICEVELNIG